MGSGSAFTGPEALGFSTQGLDHWTLEKLLPDSSVDEFAPAREEPLLHRVREREGCSQHELTTE